MSENKMPNKKIVPFNPPPISEKTKDLLKDGEKTSDLKEMENTASDIIKRAIDANGHLIAPHLKMIEAASKTIALTFGGWIDSVYEGAAQWEEKYNDLLKKQSIPSNGEKVEEIPTNQPGIDREEKEIADHSLQWVEEEAERQYMASTYQKPLGRIMWNLAAKGMAFAIYSKTALNKPVSAVNAPTEIPEEIKYWVEQFAECDADNDATLWINGAKSMYRKLQEEIAQVVENAVAFSKLSVRQTNEIVALQASLSSIKREIEIWQDAFNKICAEKSDYLSKMETEQMKVASMTEDRDLYRKESEDLRKELELANEDRAGKNVENAEYREALEIIERGYDPNAYRPGIHIGYAGAKEIAGDILNKYPKKEEEQ